MRFAFYLFYLLSYLGFRLGEGLVRLLPIEAAFAVGQGIGELAYRVHWRRRRIALRNLRLAFGKEKSESRLRALNREHFQLLGGNFLAGLKASTMPDERIWERVTANVPEIRARSGWVALISHIGNWELFSHLGTKFPEYRFGAVYQSQANPYIDRYLRRTRTGAGTVLFDRSTGILRCVRFLAEGGVVGVLFDQGAGYAGLWTPLFGRLASSTTLPATLAIRTGTPVVPIAIHTTGRARWELIISDPVYPEEDESAERLTFRINGLLEGQIRHSPADWLWSHKRWKPLRPHFLFARNQRRVFVPPELAMGALDPFRILIVPPVAMEECAALLPALRAIKKGRPDNSLAVLAPSTSLKFWQDSGMTDHVIEQSNRDGVLALASKVKRGGDFDAAIFFGGSRAVAAAAWLAAVPIRVGLQRESGALFYNQHLAEPPPGFTPPTAYLHMARSVGANINQPEF